MNRHHTALLTFACAFILTAPATKAPAADNSKPPLPEGALARVGSLRLRHRGQVQTLAFLPDGRSLASLGDNNEFCVWDAATGDEVRWLKPRATPAPRTPQQYIQLMILRGQRNVRFLGAEMGDITLAAFSPDGKLLAAGGAAGVRLFDTATAAELKRLPVKDVAVAVAFAADGKRLAACGIVGEEAVVFVWDVIGGKLLHRLRSPRGHGIQHLVFGPDGKFLAGASGAEVRLWDLTSGKRARVYQGHEQPVTAIAFSPDGKRLASASADQTIRLWETSSEEELGKLTGPEGPVLALAFSPDGKTLASGDGDALVRVWDLETARPVKQLAGHECPVFAVAFSLDGKTLASGGQDGGVRLWDVARGAVRLAAAAGGPVVLASFIGRGRHLVLGKQGGAVCHADPATGKVLRRFKAPKEKVGNVAFAPGGGLLAIATENEENVRLWDGARGKEVRKLEVPGGAAAMAFSPDGRLLALVESGDNTLRLWDVPTGKVLRTLGTGIGTQLLFAPNGSFLISTDGGTITLWETTTGKERCRFRAPQGGVECLAVAPDGRWLATGGGDETVRLWDVIAGKLRRGLVGHTGAVKVLAFSPDGKRLASGSGDQTVFLWDVESGEPVRQLVGHRGTVLALGFAPDGKRLVSGSDDSTALVWDLDAPQHEKRSAGVPGRRFQRLWDDLGSDDAGIAFAAHRTLAALPNAAVALLRARLAPVPPVDAALVSRLIADLDSQHFAVRQRASRVLAQLEGQAEPALRRALAVHPAAEVEKRLRSLIERLENPTLSAEELRAQRALEVLEQLGTPEARRLLAMLSHGAPGARLTRAAAAALNRLARRAHAAID